MNRHDRQARVIGADAQARLAVATIAVVGVGGLGCPALLYLAGAGIGRLRLIDDDAVDLTNLHRQILFSTADQGRPKVEAAAERLAALDPAIAIEPITARLTAANADTLLAGCDLVLDASDNFTARYAVSDAAARLALPVVFGAVSGFDGQLTVFQAGRGPCYRCLHPRPPDVPVADCATEGLIGAAAGEIGAAMAMEAVKLIAGLETLRGRLRLYDFRLGETRLLSLAARPGCPGCAGRAAPPADPTAIALDAALALPGALLVDVRTDAEWDAGHRADALHLPLDRIEADATAARRSLPQDRSWVFLCRSGARARRAVALIGKGYWLDG